MNNWKYVIGVGQTGSRLASMYAKDKDILLVFNTDERDTSGTKIKNDHRIATGGAGQSYAKGLKIWAENREKLERYLEPVENQRVVYFAASGGGCFVPENKVLMSDFSYKEIQNVKVGDKVITKDETIETVEKVWVYEKEDDELIEFELENGNTFTCTKDHKILVNINGEKIYVEARYINENDDLVSIK